MDWQKIRTSQQMQKLFTNFHVYGFCALRELLRTFETIFPRTLQISKHPKPAAWTTTSEAAKFKLFLKGAGHHIRGDS